jgi:hypothetical protein
MTGRQPVVRHSPRRFANEHGVESWRDRQEARRGREGVESMGTVIRCPRAPVGHNGFDIRMKWHGWEVRGSSKGWVPVSK